MKALLTTPGNNLRVRKNLPTPSPVLTYPIMPISSNLLSLQRKASCTCGGGCPRCRKNYPLRAKLEVSQPGDTLEQEADRVAEQVLAKSAHPDVSSAPPRIQRYTGQTTGQADTAPASVDHVLASPGRPLDLALRQDMEQRFGHDFSRVRVHSGAAAEQSARGVQARAYTVGHNMVFGADRFAPGTYEGRRLIAHELTHVVQQSGSEGIRLDQSDEKRGLSPSSHFQQGSPSADAGASLALVQRAPKDEEGDTESAALDSPYSEETEVLRLAVGAWELGKLADGTVLYNAKYWKATGISNSAFVVGPLTSDMGDFFYVYKIKGSDVKKDKHTISRSTSLGGWGSKGITPELHENLAKVEGGKELEVISTRLNPQTGSAVAPGKAGTTAAESTTEAKPPYAADDESSGGAPPFEIARFSSFLVRSGYVEKVAGLLGPEWRAMTEEQLTRHLAESFSEEQLRRKFLDVYAERQAIKVRFRKYSIISSLVIGLIWARDNIREGEWGKAAAKIGGTGVAAYALNRLLYARDLSAAAIMGSKAGQFGRWFTGAARSNRWVNFFLRDLARAFIVADISQFLKSGGGGSPSIPFDIIYVIDLEDPDTWEEPSQTMLDLGFNIWYRQECTVAHPEACWGDMYLGKVEGSILKAVFRPIDWEAMIKTGVRN